jgi:hypothetical protein
MPRRSSRIAVACALASLALAGCGLGNGPGSWIVDPGKYDMYRCNDLVARWKQLLDKEKELRALMDKARGATGGVVIGTIAYRSEYESVLTEEKIVQQQAADKKCELVATYQSDQGIR